MKNKLAGTGWRMSQDKANRIVIKLLLVLARSSTMQNIRYQTLGIKIGRQENRQVTTQCMSHLFLLKKTWVG